MSGDDTSPVACYVTWIGTSELEGTTKRGKRGPLVNRPTLDAKVW